MNIPVCIYLIWGEKLDHQSICVVVDAARLINFQWRKKRKQREVTFQIYLSSKREGFSG